jgi:23S rRNA pseudouridine2605 synthase
VVSVGRLDITSEGLLLLTNDGALARHLEHPSTALTRRYRARVHGNVDDAALRNLAKGVTVNGVRYASTEISVDRRGDGKNSWLSVSLREGKNREVRKLLTHAGLVVNRLIRISYGPYQLGNLAAGKIADVSSKVLHEQLGSDWTERLR